MSEQKHTPGPWLVKPTSSGGLLVVRPEQSLQVFPVADAHLIAAAPDLLGALRGLLDRYVGLVECGDCGKWDAEAEPQVIAASAAIAKALGGPK